MKTIEGMQSFDECKDNIKNIANLIYENSNNTMINGIRSKSLRSLLDLFDQYNELLKFKENLKNFSEALKKDKK